MIEISRLYLFYNYSLVIFLRWDKKVLKIKIPKICIVACVSKMHSHSRDLIFLHGR